MRNIPHFSILKTFRNYCSNEPFFQKLSVLVTKNKNFEKYFLRYVMDLFLKFIKKINQMYDTLITLINKLILNIKRLRRQYISHDIPIDLIRKENFLRKKLGGQQMHLFTTYLEQVTNEEDYIPNNLCDHNKVKSQIVPRTNTNTHSHMLNSSFSIMDTKYKSANGTRPCDQNCLIPIFWATKLFYQLKIVFSTKTSVLDIQNGISVSYI
jgi:hypothetical protein